MLLEAAAGQAALSRGALAEGSSAIFTFKRLAETKTITIGPSAGLGT